MNLNGNFTVRGGTNTVLSSNIGPATVGGEDGNNFKCTLKFTDGVKIQFDTVNMSADQQAEFALPEACTEDHYSVVAFYASNLNLSGQEQEICSWIPSGANKLSHVELLKITAGNHHVTFLSIGKDSS